MKKNSCETLIISWFIFTVLTVLLQTAVLEWFYNYVVVTKLMLGDVKIGFETAFWAVLGLRIILADFTFSMSEK